MKKRWQSVRSLYIHWPFCPYRCSFCPFVALAGHEQFMEQYHQALCKEIGQFGELFDVKVPIQTLFLGGGTPSVWPDHLLLDMFAKLKDVSSFVDDREVTIEVNPGTVRQEQLQLWKQVGINRLSIGVQTLNDDVLRRLNRHQTKKDVYSLLHYASIFENISIDLIIGLPVIKKSDLVRDEWKLLLEEVVTWPITHISLYCLTVHETTKLYFECKRGEIVIPDDNDVAALYQWSVDFLRLHGFNQYEVSNFARPGYESRHNKVYWEYKPYKGFGLGACSFDGHTRFQNRKSLMEYIDGVERGENIVGLQEKLTDDQKRLEKIMLGLRTTKGVSCGLICDYLSEEEKTRCKKHIEELVRKGFMYKQDKYVSLTPKGLIVEHEIIARFFSENH